MNPEADIYRHLRPTPPTPSDEICSCSGAPAIKLMTTRQVGGFNPLHCLDCNLEVPPERIGFARELAEAIAFWDSQHGAIESLELASADHEQWARAQLLDPNSPTNREARDLAQELSEHRRCYAWFFQPEADDVWQPPTVCPVCGEPLTCYEAGIFPQLLCEQDSVVVIGRGERGELARYCSVRGGAAREFTRKESRAPSCPSP